MNDPVPPHWIRPNHVTRIPRRHVIIDTEAHQAEIVGARVQTFRLACARGAWMSKAGRDWQQTGTERFTSPRALWEWVDRFTKSGRRTVVVAHNLAYDLRIAEAFRILPDLGWRLDMVRLDGGAAWCQWRRDGRSLTMIDSVSWYGASLEKVAAAIDRAKVELPGFDDSDEAWFERCAGDVEILTAAWLRTLDWVTAGDLGNWKPTGAGQGWAFLRHRHLTHKILHHALPIVAEAERAAAYAGRCEAWIHGRLRAGRWTEYDFVSAYAQVVEDFDLPCRLTGHLGPATARKALDGPRWGSALIRCRIATESPTAPMRGAGGILWPVGSWEGWLWDIEAAQVVAGGGTVEPIEGWRYDTAPALRQWAGWVLDALDGREATVGPLERMIVKQWSRTTVGRFGAQWATWDDTGEAHGADVALYQAQHGGTGRKWRLMMVGGRCLSETDRADAPDGAPQIMSFVMAVCRVKLWKAMTTAGLDHVAYVDTDGLIVDPHGARALDAAQLPGLRPKTAWQRVEVFGPRQLVLSGELRAAGIPRSAQRSGPRTWDAEVWRSLPASLRHGELDRVVVADRRFTIRGTDHRRRHVAGGGTVPLRVDG